MTQEMKSKQTIRIFFLMLALFMGATSEALALVQSDIIIDQAIDNTQGSVTFKSIAEDGKTVTITVTPTSDYYLKENADIIVYKLVSFSNAPTRSNDIGFPIADRLVVTGPVENTTNDYQFVVPDGYAGAWVSVVFTAKTPASALVSAKDLTYNGGEQELVTLGTVSGGKAENPVTYSLTENGEYNTAIPTGINVGNYTVYYKVAPDAAHSEGSGSVNVTIKKAPLTSVTLEKYVLIPGEDVSVTSVKAESMDVPSTDYDITGDDGTAIGDYTLTVTAKDGTNYTGSVSANYSIKDVIRIPGDNLGDSPDMTAHYMITAEVDASYLSGFSSGTFSGILEAAIDPTTHMPYKIKNLGTPIFTTLTGTVKNLVLEDVDISGNTGNTGAIACEASDDARIYNVGILSGSVGGTAYTGGLVGLLDGKARVVNCYSFADITGGSEVGGIVGHNNVATTSANLKTMVFCCMFYGDISENITNKAPIYNGEIITNVSTGTGNNNKGVSNFNYFRLEASYVKPTGVTYNCALGAEDRFLKRFEFYRHLLNSHRELAGWWATGSYDKSQMLKWVLEPSQTGTSTPYPILKEQGRYHSVVNIDNLDVENAKSRSIGRKLGTLTVNIQMDNATDNTVPFHHPGTGENEAKITKPQLTLDITDKDPDHYNFNYYKVQLPYYNDVGTKNYTGNRVVTGWKIVSITGGNTGSFTTGDDATANAVGEIITAPYNFADRHCTNKDLYDKGDDGSDRVFNQGAYWDVPDGVNAITIEPYWAKAAYVADAYPDVVYNTGMSTAYNVPNVGGGEKYKNNTNYNIAGEQQKVYTTVSSAVSALSPNASHTVNDYAVVLVGNVHQYSAKNSAIGGSNKYTVTTIDLDGDNEPDYSFMLRDDGRNEMHPLKWDFLNLVGLGMAQKSTEGTGTYNLGILCPKGWFETTNTALLRVTQMEYEHSSRTATDALIVQGGVMEQWVSSQQKGTSNNIPYIHVGGNVWFKEFQIGCHQDKSIATKHSPISVTGGDYDEFYLTGLYRGDVTSKGDNAECYINGGRFGIVCGAAMEGIGKANGADNTGNIIWQIQNADIDEFYAGGINAASRKIAEGNLTTVVEGGYIKLFCGGPKFGDMNTGKTVITTANGTIFDSFFGAGYGGNSYSRQAPKNHNNIVNFPHNDSEAGNDDSWNDWVGRFYKQAYNATYGGVSTQFSYQFLPMSGNADNVARIFVDYVKFSLATTRSVTSTLTDCTITGNFYGGGSLGKVAGDVTSTLDGCTVKGNVFGAGFSATEPNVVVDAIGFEEEPYYYTNLGTYRTGTKYFDDPDYVHTEFKDDGTPKYAPTTYTWVQGDANSTVSINTTDHTLSTPENLAKSNLGSVNGNVILTIKGDSKIGTDGNTTKGNVFGGGESSYVTGSNHKVIVTLAGKTQVLGNVYGGGDSGVVEGSTEVNIQTTVDD